MGVGGPLALVRHFLPTSISFLLYIAPFSNIYKPCTNLVSIHPSHSFRNHKVKNIICYLPQILWPNISHKFPKKTVTRHQPQFLVLEGQTDLMAVHPV
jgi:hypothetical protein